MRNQRKKLKVREIKVTVYDTIKKLEKVINVTVSEVEDGAELPEGCIFISEEIVSETEVVYKMTPQEFVKHATIEKVKPVEPDEE